MAFGELMPWRRKNTGSRAEDSPFGTLQREVNQVLDRFTRRMGRGEMTGQEELWGGFFPSVDVSETDKEIHVTAELPGLDEKDLDLSLSNNNLIIRGEKRSEEEEKGEHFYRKESSSGSFYRSIPLSAEVIEDQVDATFKKGVLKVRLPKSPEAQQAKKKISIH